MPAIVLESSLGSEYEDSPSSYEFPERYLSLFDATRLGQPLVAIIYEPRGDDNRGRMAYVAMAMISRPPVLTDRRSGNGRRLWHVDYDSPAQQFSTPVLREPFGEPVETLLRSIPRGRLRNVATFGRAVRELPDADLAAIIELGNAPLVDSVYPILDEHLSGDQLVAERSRRLVEAFAREASFRERLLAAYGYRCSVSGLGLGGVSKSKSLGLLDAAHIRPVSRSGSDSVTNGIPLSPTIHRLFDAGLFTVQYVDDRPRLKTSPRLERSMIEVPERGFSIPLRDGLDLLLPENRSLWPHPEQLRYHEREVFRAS